MKRFTRSKSRSRGRADSRDKDPIAKRWLSGISVGNWGLGLNFEDESQHGGSSSNAIMVDRSEPTVNLMAPLQLARSRALSEERRDSILAAAKGTGSEIPCSADRTGEIARTETPALEAKSRVSAAGIAGPEFQRAKESAIQATPSRNVSEPSASTLADEGKQAYGTKEITAGPGTRSVRWSLMPAKEPSVEMSAVMAMARSRSSLDQRASVSTVGVHVSSGGRCVAGEGVYHPAHHHQQQSVSKGPSTAGIPATHRQGVLGSPFTTAGAAPTQRSDNKDQGRDKAGSEGEERERAREGARQEKKQMPPVSFLAAHTSSLGLNQNGRNATTHAAVFSSSGGITDNGSSQSWLSGSKGRNSSLALSESGGICEDPLSSSSRSGLDSCTEDAPLIERRPSASNKSPRPPSGFLASLNAALLSLDIVSSDSPQGKPVTHLFPSPEASARSCSSSTHQAALNAALEDRSPAPAPARDVTTANNKTPDALSRHTSLLHQKTLSTPAARHIRDSSAASNISTEKKSMGTGVSVADVVANKLFKWGSKKEAPSGIPTPNREVNAPPPRPARSHASGYVGGYPQTPSGTYRPSSQRQELDYNTMQRDEKMLGPLVSHLDQNKLDELMARQKMLEDRINQLKMERDHLLLDVTAQPPIHKVHHGAPAPVQHQHFPIHNQQYLGHPIQSAPLRVPSTSSQPQSPPGASHTSSVSSAAHARQLSDIALPIQFPMPPQSGPQPPFANQQSSVPTSPARSRGSRAVPTSKPGQPLRTSPMAIHSSTRQDPSATSVHYVSRPLPQPPSDATPPPEYEPPELAFGSHRQSSSSYRDVKLKLVPASGSITARDVIIEEPIPTPEDEKDAANVSPRDDVDAEDIIGWFETLKFASAGPRGRGPLTPIPRPEVGDRKIHHSANGDEKLGLPVDYYDVKLKDASPTDRFDMKKDWKTSRQKRSHSRLRDQAREAEALRLAAV
ncbi:hypothetical protein Dda_6781 [Drechslerella dactyloides]|uniref:Uncharacterized protein n=1 Tax=Drechslerella dactyloides TaxID=74499 RepID=A0AAD6NHQ5_DREDA|nr:hypothetical protein Dda_6781 [Drechslerella dactyloides]